MKTQGSAAFDLKSLQSLTIPYAGKQTLAQRFSRCSRATAYLPTATYHALSLIIHDQFQDSDLRSREPGVSLFSLLDVDVPVKMRNRLLPRLQHWRRTLQIRFPSLRQTFLLLALRDYYHYRAKVGKDQRTANGLGPKNWSLPRFG